MQEYKVRAYFDDRYLINVEVDKDFFPNNEKDFALVLNREVIDLNVEKIEEKEDEFIYSLSFSEELQIGLDYKLVTYNNYSVDLKYRYIVKTPWFDQEFYYDGDDLGAVVSNGITSFKLWAPTSQDVWLNIDERMYKMKREDKGVYHLSFAGDLTGKYYHYIVEVNGSSYKIIDPYGKAQSANGQDSVVFSFSGSNITQREKCDSVLIYETSVRNYSEEKTFAGMTAQLSHLVDLGVSHVQLMPINDFFSVDDYHPDLYCNWGYDPRSYQALKMSYSTNVDDPFSVINEFKTLVDTIHDKKMRITLDVVFNHHYNASCSSFNRSVPYYYFRYDENGKLADKTYCGSEFDSKRMMCRKYFVDTLKYFVHYYDVDGFRFDLMSFLDVETMQLISRELKELKEDILLYGEGWLMDTTEKEVKLANLSNKELLKDYLFFDDGFRDLFKGSTFAIKAKGYLTGDLSLAERSLKYFTDSDSQRINYVQCHDDMTCFDKVKACCQDEDESTLKQRQKLLIGCVMLANGTSFLSEGQEFCISKNGLNNGYNADDSINNLSCHKKEEYQDVIEFTSQLASIKHRYHLGNVRYDATIRDDRLLLKIDYLKILINPTKEEYIYEFNGEKRIIFDGQKATNIVANSSIKVAPLTLVILQEM